MSGVSRCKSFLRDLDICMLKSIKVKIKRSNVLQPDYPQPIYRGLDDPKSLVVHFKREAIRGIFDREDIIVNQEFSEEGNLKTHRSRNAERRSVSSEGRFEEKRNRSRDALHDTKYKDSSGRSRDNKNYKRSRSRTSERFPKDSPRYRRDRSRSPSYRNQSSSPKRIASRRDQQIKEKRSRSYSPNPPIKRPGLYIPPKSDYLRYEKLMTERSSRSRSPVSSRTTRFDREKRRRSSRSGDITMDHSSHSYPASNERRRSKTPHEDHASTSKQHMRSPTYRKRRSRSLSPGQHSDRYREKTTNKSAEQFDDQKDRKYKSQPKSYSRFRSPRRCRTPKRRSRSRGRINDSRSSSRRSKEYSRGRSRSRSRHRERMAEDDIHFQQNMPPYIVKDGEYWIPAGPIAGPGYLPRGYLPPHILYPRAFHPPLIMPRMPMMQPFRPRIYRPRIQAQSSNATSIATNDSQKTNNSRKEEGDQGINISEIEDNSKGIQPLVAESTLGETSTGISEISIEKDEAKNDC